MKTYHYRARTYDAATGRFLQTDPIGYADSMNLYEYATGNPTNWVDPSGLLYELMHPGGKALPRANDSIDPLTKKLGESAGTLVMVPVVLKAQLDCVGGGVCEFLADPKGNIDALLNSLDDFSEVVIERNVRIYLNVKESNRPWKTFVSEEIRLGKDLWGPVGINALEGYCDQIDRAAGDDFWESCKARAEITIVVTELYYAGKGVLKAGKQIINNADNIADDIVINTRGRACKVEVKQVANATDAADIGKGSLRKRLGEPPSHMKKPEAHHDLAKKLADRFKKARLDINDPRYGRWVEGGPYGNHQKWSKAFNDEWEKFFQINERPAPQDIIEFMNKLRNNPRFR